NIKENFLARLSYSIASSLHRPLVQHCRWQQATSLQCRFHYFPAASKYKSIPQKRNVILQKTKRAVTVSDMIFFHQKNKLLT
ncbi:MAG: hypothetical protein ABI091_14285, partial [Ferruginibacter sp.]